MVLLKQTFQERASTQKAKFMWCPCDLYQFASIYVHSNTILTKIDFSKKNTFLSRVIHNKQEVHFLAENLQISIRSETW